jgi:hypothetical protein
MMAFLVEQGRFLFIDRIFSKARSRDFRYRGLVLCRVKPGIMQLGAFGKVWRHIDERCLQQAIFGARFLQCVHGRLMP